MKIQESILVYYVGLKYLKDIRSSFLKCLILFKSGLNSCRQKNYVKRCHKKTLVCVLGFFCFLLGSFKDTKFNKHDVSVEILDFFLFENKSFKKITENNNNNFQISTKFKPIE